MEIKDKLEELKNMLQNMQRIMVAFSGGVDSSFLIKVAHDVLQDDVLAVTARSVTFPEREFKLASEFAAQLGVKQLIITCEELEIDGFSTNPVNRCYLCKKELFSKIKLVGQEYQCNYILDGSNLDDTGDYRPGMQALEELGIVSPLKEVGLTKREIRQLSKEYNLPTWDKPAFACLSSRFPYGHEINIQKLNMVEKAEVYLLNKGFKTVRVRHHEDIARIEVSYDERFKFFESGTMDKVNEEFRRIGFNYVTLDLQGYRAGSMNEVL
ncbi:MAG: adenine nucleotide alpha hydrolase [Desulfitibacter sp. BRH_c19]|nr:MAG: adenine nucleotide alpha hydrolase [Desulfitibacter sp. BRH_c19]